MPRATRDSSRVLIEEVARRLVQAEKPARQARLIYGARIGIHGAGFGIQEPASAVHAWNSHAGLMPRKLSAGLLLYRRRNHDDEIVLEVLLAHMGGPFWARKDDGAWSIPKGEYEPGEDPFAAAKREFEEELGSAPPSVVYRDLGSVIQPGGKLVTAWAAEADFDAAGAVSNTFELEWPRGSGRMRSFPEIDKAGWFTTEVARHKLLKGQQPLIERLLHLLAT